MKIEKFNEELKELFTHFCLSQEDCTTCPLSSWNTENNICKSVDDLRAELYALEME